MGLFSWLFGKSNKCSHCWHSVETNVVRQDACAKDPLVFHDSHLGLPWIQVFGERCCCHCHETQNFIRNFGDQGNNKKLRDLPPISQSAIPEGTRELG